MRYRKMKQPVLALALALTLALAGCSQPEGAGPAYDPAALPGSTSVVSSLPESSIPDNSASVEESEPQGESSSSETVEAGELTVRFGDDGPSFSLHLYDNPTAAAIARHVGTASWRLPIYHYDDYDNWEVMQYYDIPSRYEIPSGAESVTSEAAGTVYYSEPNRILLFYHEAEVSGEYTPVGTFDYTDAFASAVENNPVLEGWNTKMVIISADR